MIRKAIIVVLTLAAAGASFLWADSYRSRVVMNGRPFSGWCFDCKLSGEWGLHLTVRVGGICPSYRSPVDPSAVDERYLSLTGNFGYATYPYKPCPVKEHHVIEPPGMRLVIHAVCLPLWFLMILFSTYPAIAFVRGPLRQYRRHRRRKCGLCIQCSYDLTGNVTGICPECGKEISLA